MSLLLGPPGSGVQWAWVCGILLLLVAGVVPPVSAQQTVTAYLGEEIPLSGASTGSETVYLFVTGPNLPAGGGSLESPFDPVVTGEPETFTTAPVRGDDTWSVRWDTAGTGLDGGKYSVYIVDAPVGRRDLAGHSYAVVPVVLIGPGSVGVVETPAAETTAELTTTPTPSPTGLPATAPTPAATPAPAPLAGTIAACIIVGALLAMRHR
ncbi:hypothetical protein ABH15_05985 [Methanoculleus taiwanensis]|uniref:Uncharacterized protein n=1 Tax=Methanoculleus taiwanensis TaxID=1550565 RepID=A0A498H066_9EURY|nr:hypothetical protein [Methanoculleus taiwanensis]RXE55777.1 hypothetical protein ABH15_05985 [Methanoculleus taiwanensis]